MKLNLGQEYIFQEKNNEIIATFNLYLNLATYQEQQVKWNWYQPYFYFEIRNKFLEFGVSLDLRKS